MSALNIRCRQRVGITRISDPQNDKNLISENRIDTKVNPKVKRKVQIEKNKTNILDTNEPTFNNSGEIIGHEIVAREMHKNQWNGEHNKNEVENHRVEGESQIAASLPTRRLLNDRTRAQTPLLLIIILILIRRLIAISRILLETIPGLDEYF